LSILFWFKCGGKLLSILMLEAGEKMECFMKWASWRNNEVEEL
jgi:hypothetical protein